MIDITAGMIRGWKKLIYCGFDRNMVVYDVDAKPDELTTRLISLMKVVGRKHGSPLSALLVPSESISQNLVHGIPIVGVPELNIGGEWLHQYYEVKKATYAPQKQYLVIGLSHIDRWKDDFRRINNKCVLLGSF